VIRVLRRVAVDTNVLIYAENISLNPGNLPKAIRARALLDALAEDVAIQVVIPLQVLAEFYHVLRRKAGRSGDEARFAVLRFREAYSLVPTTEAVVAAALDLAAEHQFTIFDAIIVNAAADAGCHALISEDMQHGSVWRGVRIVAPFVGDAIVPPGLR